MSLSKRVRPGVEAAPWIVQEIAALEAKVRELEAENFALAAGSCCEIDGLTADEGGVIYCRKVKQLTASRQQVEQLVEALQAARNHLDWIGWGDSYERECARESGLNEQIEKVLFTIQQAKEQS